MRLTLLKTGLRDELRRPWLMLLMVLSLALGVGVVVSVDLANESATRAFELSTQAVVGKATHQILGGPGGIDEAVYRDLRVRRVCQICAPIVEGYAAAAELGGESVHVVGIDLFAESPFRSYLANSAQLPVESLAAFFTEPGAVLVSADSASHFGLKTGDKITLTIGTQPRAVVIAGLLRPPNEISSRALEGLMLADIATAQELFDMRGRLSRIDLIATPAVAQAIAASLTADLRIVPASEQANTVTQLTAAFQLNLAAISLLALVVGMFLIYNTMMFSVVQRRRVFGILRSLGVTGREILTLILFESALAGIVGSLLGLGLGILLGRFTVGLVTRTINDLYFNVAVSSVDVQPWTLLKGLVIGIGAAMLAAFLPAVEAAGVPPITLLQRSDLEARVRRAVPKYNLVGIALALAGAGLLVPSHGVTLSFAGIFVGLFGITLLVPALTIGLMALASSAFGRFGLTARMAARTVVGALSRTSVAIAALMIAVSVTIGVTVMIASFRTTVVNWLDQTLTADFFVSPPELGANIAVALDPAVAERIKTVPGIASVELLRAVAITSPEYGTVRLNAVEPGHQRDSKLFRSTLASPAQAWQQFEQGAVIITEPFANRHKLAPGEKLTLLTDHGPRSFDIAGIYYDYSSDQGLVLMSLDVYRGNWSDSTITGAAAYADPAANMIQVEEALRRALGGSQVVVQSNKALREAALVIFDRTFAITAALRLIAVVVAIIGVLSALMALQLERTRELGTLRAAGMTLPQLWRLTALESGMMGATAGLLSIPTGLALSAVLIYVINLRSFGWTIFFQPVQSTFLEALAVSVVAAVLASVYPMIRLGRLQPADALREE